MLVLVVDTRKGHDKVIINDGEIVVQLLRITNSGQVRLGITAPKNVPIHRESVQKLVDAAKDGHTESS